MHLAYLEIEISQEKSFFSGFFTVGKTWLWQNIVWAAYLLQIASDESLWPCKMQRICNDFTVALKMLDEFNRKQMYDSIITGKENASKEWSCIISMFLASFNVYFVFGYACFMCICVKNCYLFFCGFFWDKVCCFWWKDVGNPGSYRLRFRSSSITKRTK